MKRKDYLIVIIVLFVMAILVLCERIAIPCIFHKITGFYCPGCGITRAIKALLKGDIYTSIRNNLLLYIVVPVIVISEILNRLTKRKFKKCYNTILIFLLIITIGYGILRNIPQFSYFAPIG